MAWYFEFKAMGQRLRSSQPAFPSNYLLAPITMIYRTGVAKCRGIYRLYTLGRIPMKVAVHRFQVWDSTSDTMKTSTRYATVDAILDSAHGVVAPGTEILIDTRELSKDVEGMTVKDYRPTARPA
jgi:hypothetical protein